MICTLILLGSFVWHGLYPWDDTALIVGWFGGVMGLFMSLAWKLFVTH